MAWNLHITGPAQKEFRKLPAKDQARVKDALLAMQQDPFSGDGDDQSPQRQAAAPARAEARDLELINKAAPELNEEVEDILRYQDRALKMALPLE